MILVPIIILQDPAIFVVCSNQISIHRPDIEAATLPRHNAAYMVPGIFTFWYICSDDVAILKSLDPLGRLLELQNNNAAAVDLAAEAGSPAHCLGVQAAASGQVPIATIRHRANAQGVVVVVFGQAKPDAVILRLATGGALHIIKDVEEGFLNIPAVGVCPGTVAVGNQRLIAGLYPLDALEPGLRQLFAGCRALDPTLNGRPLIQGQVALVLVAGVAGQRRILDAIVAALASWLNMLPLQDGIPGLSATVLALVAVPVQQVLPELVAEEGSLLIFVTFDVRVVQQLRIETHCLEGAAGDVQQPSQAAHPVDDIVAHRPHRRRQPALRPVGVHLVLTVLGQVVVDVLAPPVAGLPLTAIAPGRAANLQGFDHQFAAVFDLHKEDSRVVVLPDDGQASVLGARVNLDAEAREVVHLSGILVL